MQLRLLLPHSRFLVLPGEPNFHFITVPLKITTQTHCQYLHQKEVLFPLDVFYGVWVHLHAADELALHIHVVHMVTIEPV